MKYWQVQSENNGFCNAYSCTYKCLKCEKCLNMVYARGEHKTVFFVKHKCEVIMYCED